ncbi:hypothetical protein QTA57_16495 [Fontisubflavum oceani]|jgi:hypothetical protein|uniref:hypothetical protein n=1 Tax=Fontisubflavum oceani TaxID=2978973 RepID=UPI00119A1640|nr:hypothetical protein [Fontisubflavum oceani]WJY21338.1 hypothetical protein QTA57_16495 [Fontisubflavum oceani]
MRIKTLLAALALMTAPSLAIAECSWGHGSNEASISCAQGTTWDAESQRCVTSVSS